MHSIGPLFMFLQTVIMLSSAPCRGLTLSIRRDTVQAHMKSYPTVCRLGHISCCTRSRSGLTSSTLRDTGGEALHAWNDTTPLLRLRVVPEL
jgi:hypothetical protein